MGENPKYYGMRFDRRSQNFDFHMIAQWQLIAGDRRRSQEIGSIFCIVCDHDRRIADDRRSMFPYDRRRSQTLLRSAICDPRSYGDQPLCSIFCDRLRSSAIMIAGSQTIAEVCFHMIADDRRRSQTLLRSAIRDHMETSLNYSK